jgi:hypothetical protein
MTVPLLRIEGCLYKVIDPEAAAKIILEKGKQEPEDPYQPKIVYISSGNDQKPKLPTSAETETRPWLQP